VFTCAQSRVAMEVMAPGSFISLFQASAHAFTTGLVVFENPMAEVVGADKRPDVFNGIEFRCIGRQRQQNNVVRHGELRGGMPTCTAGYHYGDGAHTNAAADLCKVLVHRFKID